MIQKFSNPKSMPMTRFVSNLKTGTLVVLATFCFSKTLPAQTKARPGIKTVSRIVSADKADFLGSYYTSSKENRLRTGNQVSDDNGATWRTEPMTPDYSKGLPEGFRRNTVTSVLDPRNGRIVTLVNALDVAGLDPKIAEPKIAQQTYYLRYRVSKDGAKTWLYEEPIIEQGDYTAEHPLPGLFIGKSSIYLGDAGCIPLVTKKGRILVPAQTTPLDEGGKLYNPGNGHTYTDVVILIGTWTKDRKLAWKSSKRIVADPATSTRGMIEPTLTELKDGRILMVMRGGNLKNGQRESDLPSHKWYSISKDGGETWDTPKPWTYDDDKPFFSPSSMSTLFRHSSGRHFWAGNVTDSNPQGNLPRWPLLMGEVDGKTGKLIRSSMVTVDTQQEADKSRGRLDISHITFVEDRVTKEIILSYPRSYNAYKSREWVTVRFSVE